VVEAMRFRLPGLSTAGSATPGRSTASVWWL